jgi:hypothetical protein
VKEDQVHKISHMPTHNKPTPFMSPQYSNDPTTAGRRLPESAMAAGGRGGSQNHHHNSSMDNDDDLSIVASDEDASSQDSHGLLARGPKDSKSGGDGTSSGGAQAPIDLVRKETYYVNVLRYTFVGLLLTSAIFVGVGTWFWVSDATGKGGNDDNLACYAAQDFDFTRFASAVNTSLVQAFATRLSVAHTLSATITALALQQQLQPAWPYVSIPHLEPQTMGLFPTLTGTNRIIFAPLVPSSLRSTFESFARSAPDCATTPGCTEIYNVDETRINDATTTNNSDMIFSPVLQTSPGFQVSQENSFLLVDLFSDAIQGPALTKLMETKAAVFSNIMEEELTSTGQALLFDSSSTFTTPRSQVLEASTSPGPTTTLLYPILQEFEDQSSQPTVVGSLSMNIGWRPLLEQSLPFGFLGAVMVLEQSCQPELQLGFVVRDEAGTVEYTGPVEVTQEELDGEGWEEQVITLPTIYEYGVFDQGGKDTGSNCTFRVRLYPDSSYVRTLAESRSDNGIDGDDGSKPILYTAIVAFLFLAMLIVFLTYDWLVERRQSVVINIATKSSAIVENLFPAQVRDRMLQNIAEKAAADKAEDKPSSTPGAQSGDGTPNGGPKSTSTTTGGKPAAADTAVSVKQFLTNMPENFNDFSSQPIADLFTNTTVLFADIAGFTAWSSQREPPQVFTLLETLYRSFDVIAAKLKVFKVGLALGDMWMRFCFLC